MKSAIPRPSGTEKTMPDIPLAAIPSSAVGMLCHYWLGCWERLSHSGSSCIQQRTLSQKDIVQQAVDSLVASRDVSIAHGDIDYRRQSL